ncbi:DNA ligase [Motiliproteus sediminis]|uniref:DNA ligase n=1 Tax=Motiliproteus sediminis TaxID=1468178 RepID=UPI001FE2C971|nr:DNA ligase [Motiliproteus sediminis]
MIRMITFWLILWSGTPLAAPPELMLANRYHHGINVSDYWVSEKLDGVRAYWDGTQLLSRSGNRLAAPDWFIAGFPGTALDGELWAGRQQFERVLSAINSVGNDEAWRHISYWVFDLPHDPRPFSQRLGSLEQLVGRHQLPHLQLVRQKRATNREQLFSRLEQVTDEGGEGLMLHRGDSRYHARRSDDLIKLKLHADAEAVVIAHLPGKGKHQGRLGALLVEDQQGRQFRLGSGFTDQQRRHPPPLGTEVTYKYYGITANGLPRFASFLRVRQHP